MMNRQMTMSGVYRGQQGMTLVELMVALVIGLLMSLAIFGVIASFEGQKRTATSTNDINQAGSYAMYVLDRWVRSAGSGYSQTVVLSSLPKTPTVSGPPFGCMLHAVNAAGQTLPRLSALPAPFENLNTTGVQNEFRLAPILIAPGQTLPAVSGSPSDVLIIMAGVTGRDESPVEYKTAPVAPNLTPINTINYNANDLVLLIQKTAAPQAVVPPVSPYSTQPCFIEQLAAGFVGGRGILDLVFGGSFYAPTIGGKLLNDFDDEGWVANIGNIAPAGQITDKNPPLFMVLGVGANNTLFSYDLLGTSPTPLLPVADSVFEMHALYGVDSVAPFDGQVDAWVSPSAAAGNYTLAALMAGTDAAAMSLARIRAVKVGLIMRTALPEKTTATTFAAPSSLTLFAPPVAYVRTLTTAERAFRYRTIETTIPLRNVLTVPTLP